jgi:cytoskeleton protein RodZ
VSTGIGASLRDAREAQGRSLEEAASALRARGSQLEALEEERFDTFGGDVYAKGFLKSYAIELGLDPQPLLDAYRRQVSHDDTGLALGSSVARPRRTRSAPPAWIAWVLASVVVLAGISLLGVFSDGGRAPDQASPTEPDGPPVAPAERDGDEDDDPADDTDDPVDDDEPDGADEPDEEPEPEPEPTGVDLLIALEEASWMRVIVDGSLFLEQTVEAGETLPFEADQEIEIRFGNPGGVRVNLNGEDLGAPGAPGQPETFRYTVDGQEQA